MIQSVSITVKGIVQGVYYRQSTKEKATRKGITGVVKNLPDGNVHIIATGTEIQIREFIEWCRIGPDTSVVSDVIVKEVPLQSFTDFRIVK